MKKGYSLFFSLLLIMLLFTACSAKDPNTLQGVYDKALKASEKLKNFELNMDMNQEVTLPEMDKMSIDSKIKAQIQTDPQAFYQEIETMGTKMKMYDTKDGLYIQDPSSNKWMKAPQDYLQQFNQLSQGQQNPVEQLRQLEKYVDQFKLEEKKDAFELTFSGKGDKVNQFVQEMLSKSLPKGGVQPI